MISHQNLTSLDLKISGKPFVGFADIFIFAINWNLAKSNASPVDGTPPIESQNQDTNTKIYKLKKYENSKWPKLKFACQFCRKTGCPVPPHKNQALTCPVEINKTWGQIWLKIPLITLFITPTNYASEEERVGKLYVQIVTIFFTEMSFKSERMYCFLLSCEYITNISITIYALFELLDQSFYALSRLAPPELHPRLAPHIPGVNTISTNLLSDG